MIADDGLPLVSVVLPVYNSEKYIRRVLDSVFSQTYTNYEVIIIDDGSVDSTSQLIKEYNQSVVYLYQENAGASAARNTGMTRSIGELIAFIDADDMWHPEKLKMQVDAYLHNKNVSMIHTGYDKQAQFKGFPEVDADHVRVVNSSFEAIFKMPYLQTPSVMIPRRILDDVGMFDVSLPTAEDVDFFLRCSYQQEVIYIPDVLVFVSINSGSLCDDLRSYLDNIKVVDDFVTKHPVFLNKNRKLVSNVRANIYCDYADELCFKGMCVDAVKACLVSIGSALSIRALMLLAKSLAKILLNRCN